MRRCAWLSLFALVAGCASGTVDPQWATRERDVVAASAFVATSDLPVGFDALESDVGVAVGDEVLFGLRLQRGDEARDWFLHVVVVTIEPVSWQYPDGKLRELVCVRSAVHAGDGALLGEETLKLERDFLERGLARACRDEGRQRGNTLQNRGPDDWPESFRAHLALSQLLTIARKSPILRPLLYEVVDMPSLWSVITHFGARMSMKAHFDDVRTVEGERLGGAAVPAWSLPHELLINGDPALHNHILVTDPHSPLALCAGIVAITSVHPTDSSRVFTMRLIAARRGGSR
ncbi:MAG: hypothetical protein H6838_13715 [Planctomycetes bacterium]|nr:hypothetical protein [Planctomycetota bacterium]MCB9886546.1 hypothetical protein [Planctomycetota bacterium]